MTLQGRIELGKAVESKDAEVIRGALDKLYKLYEAEVEARQAQKQ
ncbi:hypothetical protein N0M98_09980 [Paenibacillus doosanensis]|nr:MULTISPECIES: hypothetical protein [Paenibacillus]MCS7460468.1 hypothetical protein [Paenibacillus doosanensis]